MIHAVNEAALGPVIDKAWDAGIPTINFDIECFAENRIAYVHHLMQGPGGSDVMGQYFVDKAEDLGYTAEDPMQVLEIWNLFEMENSHLRHEGFHTAVDKSPLVDVLEGTEFKATDELAAAIVMDEFTAHPDLDGIYVQGGGGEGAVEGLAAIGRLLPRDDPDHVFVALNDVDTRVVEEIDEGRVDATGSHGLSDLGDVAFHVTLNYVVLGISPPQMDIVVPMYAVTAESIDTLQILGVPVYPRLPTSQWDIWPPCDPSPTGCLQLEPGHKPWQMEIPNLEKRMELLGY
jgi:ABC-type sugar transport system substrate-binding protein